MKIFLAGNFPVMSKEGEEIKMKDIALSNHSHYRRLISFFYKDISQSVLNLKGAKNEDKPKRLVTRT